MSLRFLLALTALCLASLHAFTARVPLWIPIVLLALALLLSPALRLQ